MSLHDRCFAFEDDFVADLRCLPMAVRRKLDLAGVKLRLSHWNALTAGERAELLAWPDHPGAISDLRLWLQGRTATLADGPARGLNRPQASTGSRQRSFPSGCRPPAPSWVRPSSPASGNPWMSCSVLPW